MAISNITLSTTKSNITVDVTNTTVSVGQTLSNIVVGTSTGLSNTVIRGTISVTDTGGDGSLSYNNTSGVFTYTGPSATEVRSHFSNTSPILYDTSTGVISIDSDSIINETVVDNGNLSGNITLNIGAGRLHKVGLTGTDITGITLANISSGASATIIFTQDSSGGTELDTTTHSSNWALWEFANDFRQLDVGPNNWTVLNLFYDGTNYYASLVHDSAGFIQNNELANSNVVVNGVTIDLGSSGTIVANTDLTAFSVTQASASGSGTLAYNNTSGVFTYTPPDLTAFGLTNAQAQAYIQTNGLNGSGDITMTGVATFGNAATQTHTFTGNVDVTGNIEVSGNLNYRNVEDLYVRDQSITLNANAATDATVSIIANRPVAGSNTVLRWNETSDAWQFTNDGSTYYNIPTSTSDLAEGTNLYYTQSRFDTAFGNKTTTDLSEGTNLYYTDARFDTRLSAKDTDNLSEGSTNLYYTDARSRAAVSTTTASASGGGALAYDNGTGVFTYTPPDLTAFGLTNAQAQAYIQSNGLAMTSVISSNSNITTTANISGNYILGNGSQLSGIIASDLNANSIFIGNSTNQATTVGLNSLSSSIVTNKRLEGDRFSGGNVTLPISQYLTSGFVYVKFDNAVDPFLPNGTKVFFQDTDANNPLSNGSITSDNIFYSRKSSSYSYYLLYSDEACQNLVSTSVPTTSPTNANVTFGSMIATGPLTMSAGTGAELVNGSNAYAKDFFVRNNVTIGETALRDAVLDVSGDATITNFSGNAALTLVNNRNDSGVPTQIVMKQNKNAGGAAGVAGDQLSVIQTQGITANVTQSNTSVQDAQAYNNGTLTEDSISFSGGQIFADGTQVLYNSATDGDITPLNGLTLFLKYTTGDGGRYELFDDAGFTTGSRRITNGVFRTSGVGQVETSSTSAGSLTVFANVLTKITDPTLGSEDAEIDFRLMKAGTETSTMLLKSTELDLNVPLTMDSNLQINADTVVGGLKGLTFDSSTNRLGLGTTTPGAGIHMVSDNDYDAQIYLEEYKTDFFGPDLRFYKARGTSSSPVKVVAGDRLSEYKPYGHTGNITAPFSDNGFLNTMGMITAIDSTNVVDDVTMPILFSWEGYKDGDYTGGTSYNSLMKLRANGDFQIGNLGFGASNTAPNFAVTNGGQVDAVGNITTTANVSGNYILGNGSQLTGITTSGTDSFGTVTVGGQTNIQASQSNAVLDINSTGDITLTTSGNTLTIGGSGGSYGNTQVNNFLTNEGVSSTLKINIDDGVPAIESIHGSDTATNGNTFNRQRSRGTGASPSAVQDGDTIAKDRFYGYDGASYEQAFQANVYVDGTVSTGDVPMGMKFAPFTGVANPPAAIDMRANSEIKFAGGNASISSAGVITANGSGLTGLTTSLISDFSSASNTAIAANLAALTSDISSSNLIKTTGNLQVNADTDVSGLSGLTFDSSTNNLGLGTTTPGAALHIRGTSNESQIFMTEYNGTSSAGIDLRTFRAGGTEGSPTVTPKSDRIWESLHYAYDGVGTSGDGISTGFQNAFSEQIITDPVVDHAANTVPVFKQYYTYLDGDTTTTAHALMRMRSNGDIQFNAGSAFAYTGAANTVISNAGNITTVGNISGNYILGNGSLLTGVSGSTDSFGTVTVAGQTNIQAGQGNAVLDIASSGAITLTTSGNTLTIGGSGGSYGNSDVETFLGSDTMTGDIVYTGNLQLSSANVTTAITEYQGNVTSGVAGDRILVASDPGWFSGQNITFSGTTNANLTFLNGNTYQVQRIGGTTYDLYTNYNTFTRLNTAIGTESNTNGLQSSTRQPENTTARFNANVYVEQGATLHADAFKSSTPNKVISMNSLRVTDFSANDPLGINIVANSALSGGAYAAPFQGAIVYVTGDKHGSRGAPAYWDGSSNWRYFSDDTTVTI